MDSFVVVVVAEPPERVVKCLAFEAESLPHARRRAVEKAGAASPYRWRVKSAERISA